LRRILAHLVIGNSRHYNCDFGTLFCGIILKVELSETDNTRLLAQYDYGDQLVEYCLETRSSQVEIFTPLTRRQAMTGPQSITGD